MTRILFVLKFRENSYGGESAQYSRCLSSGLLNSATFVCDMLKFRFETKLVQVVDNNCIDREVVAFAPDVVVIEAYWVVPEKFAELGKLHPKVKWIIRNHSNAPFLANEGIAYGWTIDYVRHPNVWVSSNHPAAHGEFVDLIAVAFDTKIGQASRRAVYLPNYYPIAGEVEPSAPYAGRGTIDVGCFGAIRPLKNQMLQALAAITWARQNGKFLRFHINGGRVEGNGEPILKNLRSTFAALETARLVEHAWLDREDFLAMVKTMDLGLQVSFSETFNIVAADFVTMGVPIVVSPEVHWVDARLHASPTSVGSIVAAMSTALNCPGWDWPDRSLAQLSRFDEDSKIHWVNGITRVLEDVK
jgi:hypothetical protein